MTGSLFSPSNAVAKGEVPAMFEVVRWGGREVRLYSRDGGESYLGSSGEPGLLLVVRRGIDGRRVARLEDRQRGQTWPGEPKRSVQLAVVALRREVLRLCRAAGVKG